MPGINRPKDLRDDLRDIFRRLTVLERQASPLVSSTNIQITTPGVLKLIAQGGTYITHTVTGAAANCVIGTTGLIRRSTSSARYKTDITPATVNVDAVLALEPRWFRARDEVTELGDAAPTYIGFIAEDAHDLGLTDWVEYDEQNRPEAFNYATWCVALQAVVRHQQEQIDTLTNHIRDLTPLR